MTTESKRLRWAAWEWFEHAEVGNQVTHAIANGGMALTMTLMIAKIHVAEVSLGWMFAALVIGYGLWLDRLAAAIAAGVLIMGTGAWRGEFWFEHASGMLDWLILLAIWVFVGLVALAGHYVYQDFAGRWMSPATIGAGRMPRAMFLGWPDMILFALLSAGYRPALRERLAAMRPSFMRTTHERTWHNWAQTQSCRPEAIWFPREVDELVEIVTLARREHKRIRVVGSSFSWSPLVPSDSFLVDMRLFDSVELDLRDPARPLAIVGAGATGRALNRVLEPAGFALSSNVVMDTVTWGGMIAVGAHGSGWNESTLSDRVHAIELVDGAGRRRRFERGRDSDEVMAAVRLALGSFGLVHRIELRIEPAFDVRLVDRKIAIDRMLADLPQLVGGHAYFDVFWFPGCKQAWVRTWDRTSAARSRRRPRPPWSMVQNRTHWGRWSNWVVNGYANSIASLMRRWPRLTPHLMRISTLTVRPWDRVVHIHAATHYRACIEVVKRLGCIEFAFAVDPEFDRVRAAWGEVEACMARWAARGRWPINLTVNLRFVGGSDCLLSPAHGNEHTCFIEVLGDGASPDWPRVVEELALAWQRILPDARPHWPKQHAGVPGIADSVRERLGDRLDRFLVVHAQLDVDPDGILRNAYLDRMLFAAHPRARERSREVA